MAILQLTSEQIRTWSRTQKDRWWRDHVYRGDLPQLTLRSAITGFLMGGLLAATNLYIGAKTGVSLGVGLTSVILAFALFRGMSRVGLGKDFTILENNALQSIATAAGYVTTPLVSSLAAYMLVSNTIVPGWQIVVWVVVISSIGVLVAFPLKRRFINEEQLPFPEGAACGVVLDALYGGAERAPEKGAEGAAAGEGSDGMYHARVLGAAAGLAGFYQLLTSDGLMRLFLFGLLRMDRWAGMKEPWHLRERIDDYYYALAAKYDLFVPRILGTDFKTLGLRLSLDASMIGVGGLMGIRVATSVFVGAGLNFFVLAPIMIARGDILPRVSAAGAVIPLTRGEIVNQWSLWWGVAMMVVGSLVSLIGKPELFRSAFRGLARKKKPEAGAGETDVLGDVELPLWVSFVGIPILSVVAAFVANSFFGVPWYYALLSLPLIFVLSIICTNAMALTSWTPTGALAKITQFSFGALDRSHPATNLTTAGMTAEIAANAANLLSDIKPGYMLGAKPRQQAVGHFIGILSGALVSAPLFFVLFLRPVNGVRTAASMVSDEFGFPAALQWKGVAELIAKGLTSLRTSAIVSMGVAAFVATIIEVVTIVRKKPFPLSTVSIGLGVVLPPEASFTMWAGAFLFWAMERRYPEKGTSGNKLWVGSKEPICAGLITGAALVGIGNALVNALVYG